MSQENLSLPWTTITALLVPDRWALSPRSHAEVRNLRSHNGKMSLLLDTLQ